MPPGTVLCKSNQTRYSAPPSSTSIANLSPKKPARTKTSNSNMSSNEEFGSDLSFYLNFVILNASDVVSAGIKEKMGRGLIGRAVSGMASAAIDADAKVTEKIAQQLEEKIPLATKEMGLDMITTAVFKQGALVVFKFTIKGAEPVKLIRSGKGDEAAEHFENIIKAMEVLGVEGGVKTVESKMLPKIKETLMIKLCEKIPAKMGEKGLQVDCTAIEPCDQADWFFSFLQATKKTK